MIALSVLSQQASREFRVNHKMSSSEWLVALLYIPAAGLDSRGEKIMLNNTLCCTTSKVYLLCSTLMFTLCSFNYQESYGIYKYSDG